MSPSRGITFNGCCVLTLETRRATELAALITNYGGRPLVAPALREIPLSSNTAALDFVHRLIDAQFDLMIFLTGAGARALLDVVDDSGLRVAYANALGQTKIVARGPKSDAVMRELKVPVWAAATEPNTWREVMAAIVQRTGERLDGLRIAVQEYGVSNAELLDDLRSRGAEVTPVPIYRWALPEDIRPLERAVHALTRSEVEVTLFTTSMQLVHLWEIATRLGLEEATRRGLDASFIASIGPTTSGEIQRRGFRVDLEASHPKIGVLVREAAERAAARPRS